MNLGAPHNPFALDNHRGGVLPYLFSGGESASALLESCRGGAHLGQILGPEGSGKTTLLHALAEGGRNAGMPVAEVRAGTDGKIQPFPPEARIVCVDEADRISWWRRAWLVRHCRRRDLVLLVTTRKDLGLPTLWRCEVDEPLVVRVAQAVLARSPDAEALVAADEAPSALRESRGNARDALLRMYDWYEARWVASHEADCDANGAPDSGAR